ncbi:class I SAM-dependent methyltransferase [Nocardia arthritidis]|uniref:Methyltransferase domain-containing protein n=1 Tax=Nocardia arthritidis TaxID=228602 RepID=A0A6G9YA59_9NOCA|nr:class I SAM-dependent methyltransferase [Nocardia arthritidis]QIS10048.1 methyltransferase domain-containing protein [Nocardia arthritidis]
MSSVPENPVPTPERVAAGAAAYTRWTLAWYDFFVLGLVCRFVWRCRRELMLESYRRNIGARHLDLGPGTGYFLNRCGFTADSSARLVLVDLSATALGNAVSRVARLHPVIFRRNVLEPLDLGAERFDSAGLNLLLHCLPGGMKHKCRVFDHVLEYVEPGGRIFGSAVLAHGVSHTRIAEKMLASLNADETFDNSADSLAELDAELAARFDDYRLTVHGSIALFEATAS